MLLSVACALMLNGSIALPAPSSGGTGPVTSPAAALPPHDLWTPLASDVTPPLRAWGSVVFCLIALAAAAWLWRRAQLRSLGVGTERIDVLAARSFGPKHRIALIETCGERLLLAMCDREMSVLSHLPAPSASACRQDVADMATSAAASMPATVPTGTPERRFEVVP